MGGITLLSTAPPTIPPEQPGPDHPHPPRLQLALQQPGNHDEPHQARRCKGIPSAKRLPRILTQGTYEQSGDHNRSGHENNPEGMGEDVPPQYCEDCRDRERGSEVGTHGERPVP